MDDSNTARADNPPEAPPDEARIGSAGKPGDTTMGMLCHLLSLSALAGIPFGNILGPLVIWLVKRHEDPFVEANGKAALNFQISILLYAFGLIFAMLFFGFIPIVQFVAVPLLFAAIIALTIAVIVYVIIASIRASDGEVYEYPFTIRFIR